MLFQFYSSVNYSTIKKNYLKVLYAANGPSCMILTFETEPMAFKLILLQFFLGYCFASMAILTS